jgi:putative ABC transport system permease protein
MRGARSSASLEISEQRPAVKKPALRSLVRAVKRWAQSTIRPQLAAMNQNLTVLNVQTADQMFERAITAPRFRAAMFVIFAGFALLLELIGICGVTSYAAARRVQEVGVRIALGATRLRVLRMMTRQLMMPVVIGTAAGLSGALFVTRLLAAYLIQVDPMDPWVFAAVPASVISVAILANFVLLRRACSIDPSSALRYE